MKSASGKLEHHAPMVGRKLVPYCNSTWSLSSVIPRGIDVEIIEIDLRWPTGSVGRIRIIEGQRGNRIENLCRLMLLSESLMRYAFT